MYNTNELIMFFIGIILVCLVFALMYPKKKELLTVDDKKQRLANDIYKFMKGDTEYKDYLQFLTINENNLSIKILEQDAFYEIRYLAKNNKLNVKDILKYITDM